MSAQVKTEGVTIPRCWCGVRNAWCSLADVSETCGGLGTLYCYCGGDFCICHNHHEVECDGCQDCEDEADFGDVDFDDDGRYIGG